MDDILVDLAPVALATAIKASLYTFLHSLGGSLGVEYFQQVGLIRLRTGIPHPN